MAGDGGSKQFELLGQQTIEVLGQQTIELFSKQFELMGQQTNDRIVGAEREGRGPKGYCHVVVGRSHV